MIQFKSFDKTPTEKYIGIATVIVDDSLMLRYKVFPGKSGSGYFISAPSVKIDEDYFPAFDFDSNFKKSEIEKCVRDNMSTRTTPLPMEPDSKVSAISIPAPPVTQNYLDLF